MAWAAATSFETTDGSTSPTDGNNITGTGDGSGWTGNWTATASRFVYDNAQAQSGTWSCNLNLASATEPTCERTLSSAVTSGTVSWRFRIANTNTSGEAFYLYSGGTRAIYTFKATNASSPCGYTVVNGASTATYSGTLAVNTWYELEIEFDCSTDTYNFYIDGTKKNGTALSFENAVTSIDKVYLKNNATGSSYPTNAWYDNIANGAAAAPSGPASLKTRDTIAKASVKTIDGIAIASVKTIDTIA